ncbi:MAG: glycosyltransferase family 2 protein [bacterium]|nr:glycosyltransferase family 2 protein [bacterium]
MKVSIAITSYNEGKNIERCLKSVKDLADEIVIVDEKSSDDTVEIAKKYTDKIFLVDHDPMFHKHKQLALENCSNDWILQIDCDEELSPSLTKEIENLDFKAGAYKIPRKSLIFGKWLEHTGWYPDYQIKLVRKNKAYYPCKSLHEDMVVDGEIKILKNDLLHYHYTSVEQFIDRMNRYTTDDAEFINKPVVWTDAIKYPLDEFLKRFFYWEGYKDGLHGLVLSLLMALNRLVVFAKLWEKQKFYDHNQKNFLTNFYNEVKKSAKDFKYWQIYIEKNPIKKLLAKII